MKNYGLNLQLEQAHRSEEDDIFGGFSAQCIADVPEEGRLNYLPIGEVQRALDDMQDCATRGPINILETKFNFLYRNNKLSPENRLWLELKGYVIEVDGVKYVNFADAYIAIKSGTTRQGNSMKAPLHAIHEWGLIPKRFMPLRPDMTWDDYYDPRRLAKEFETLGKEFITRFPIRYDVVYRQFFKELYKYDLLDLAGYAWSDPVDGVYPKTGNRPNHVFMGIQRPAHTIFDNYLGVDNLFIKRLSEDYDLMDYGYRIYVIDEVVPKKSLWERIKQLWNF